MIDGSVNIHSVTTSSTISGSWGASRSITPMLGKSIYRHVVSSITSSAARAPRAKVVSATSVVKGGPGTLAVGEGSDTFTAGRRLAVTTTWAGSDAGAITIAALRRWGRCRVLVQNNHHVLAARAGLGRRFQGCLKGSCPYGRLTLLNGGGRDWWRWCDRCPPPW
jgi:hypothetical protein